MADYRRFIAYFYEYIDGKKQKNAGFAKVELRGGLWRILFRISEGISLELPIQIYGFVRADDYLLKLPMGTMQTGAERIQEWAYRAEVPVSGQYRVEDLAGILLVSSDDREFLTVWDDEAVDPERFVLTLPQELPAAAPEQKQNTEQTSELPATTQGQNTERFVPELPETVQGHEYQGETGRQTETEQQVKAEKSTGAQERAEVKDPEKESQAEIEGQMKEDKSERKRQIVAEKQAEAIRAIRNSEMNETIETGSRPNRTPLTKEGIGEKKEKRSEPTVISGNTGISKTPMSKVVEAAETAPPCQTNPQRENPRLPKTGDDDLRKLPETRDDDLRQLYRTRTRFAPFEDGQISSCVMLRPCDIVWLQQHGWQVGRSSFLQHGFYQYRHLLLGMTDEGSWIIGVPGINNSQEKYMAGMFGFNDFKPAPNYGNNSSFGYWYRELQKRI
jgi:hypothetical protein